MPQYSSLLDWGLRLAFAAGAAGRASRCGSCRSRSSPRCTSTASSPSTTCGRRARRCSAIALGLLALILVKILAPGFYARQNLQDAGEDRVRHGARHADVRGRADVADGPCRTHAGHQHRGLRQRGIAVLVPAPARHLSCRGRDGPVFLCRSRSRSRCSAAALYALAGPAQFWLAASLWSKVGAAVRRGRGRRGGRIFGALFLLGFRFRDFNRREQV